jgi:hypothetical protein
LIFEFPSNFRGRGNTISCTFCWWRNWCYLPLFYPPSGLDFIEGRDEGMHPVVAHVLWTTLSLHRKTISEIVLIYLKYW